MQRSRYYGIVEEDSPIHFLEVWQNGYLSCGFSYVSDFAGLGCRMDLSDLCMNVSKPPSLPNVLSYMLTVVVVDGTRV